MGPSEGAAMGEKENRVSTSADFGQPRSDLIMLHACLELLPNLSPAQNKASSLVWFFLLVDIDQTISSPAVENQLQSGQKEEIP